MTSQTFPDQPAKLVDPLENFQFTLTFKRDYNRTEADGILLHRLKRLIACGVQYEIYSEIGHNLRYHYHGYFVNDTKTQQYKTTAFLMSWKKLGFIKLSKGPLATWIKYIRKDKDAPYCSHFYPEKVKTYHEDKPKEYLQSKWQGMFLQGGRPVVNH